MRSSLWNCASRAGVGGDAVGQELQRDRLIEREVVGAVHLAHAAAAEQRDEPVAAGDDGARREAVRRRRRAIAGPRAPRSGRCRRRVNRRVVVFGSRHGAILLEETSMTRKLIAATLAVALARGRHRAGARTPSAEPDRHRGHPGRREVRTPAARRRLPGRQMDRDHLRPADQARPRSVRRRRRRTTARTLNAGRAGLARRREQLDAAEDRSAARHQRQDRAARHLHACSSI